MEQINHQIGQRINEFGWQVKDHRRTAIIVAAIALFIGVVLSALASQSLSMMLAVPLALGLLLLISLRGYVLLAALMLCTAIFVDFYEIVGLPLHEPVAALVLASVILAVLFFAQSAQFPWVPMRAFGWWLLLLLVAALAIPRGGSLSQTVSYYVTIFGISVVMYFVGTQITRSYQQVRLLLILLMFVAAFIAFHTIVEGTTGHFLFATQQQANYLGSVNGFQLAGSASTRSGSFLLNPDWNGLFLAVSLFFVAGLVFSDVSSRAIRILAAITSVLLLLALLFTFTTASWLAAAIGGIVYIALFLPRRYLRRTLIGAGVGLVLGALAFSRESRLLLQHATTSQSISIRLGAWETALKIIMTHPLTGIGMGYTLYLVRAEAYRVPLQTQQLAHPHNSYLELAAFAGIPVLLAFLILLGWLFRAAWQTYRATDSQYQPLIGGIITSLIVLSINSLFINGWTLPPFACLGWLLMGGVTSKALLKQQGMPAISVAARDAENARTNGNAGKMLERASQS